MMTQVIRRQAPGAASAVRSRPGAGMARPPVPGQVVHVGRAASVQFATASACYFLVVRVDDRPTCTGWVWLHGYQLDHNGVAIAQRSIFVQPAGLVPAPWLRSPSGRCRHRLRLLLSEGSTAGAER